MERILYILRGFLICHGFIGDIYDTIWEDVNPENKEGSAYWIKYNDAANDPKAFFTNKYDEYGKVKGYIMKFSYEYVGKWFTDRYW